MTNEKDKIDAAKVWHACRQNKHQMLVDTTGGAAEIARICAEAVKAALARGRAEWFRDTSTITWSRIEMAVLEVDTNPPSDDRKPTRDQYAKWVSFYISAIDDKEARDCGCVGDGLEMLRDLYNKEKEANRG